MSRSRRRPHMLKTVGKRPASNAGGCEMKRILVPLLGDAGDRPALDMAAVVARRHGAHIDAMLFRRDPRDMIPLVGERSTEHTSELQSLMRISYAVFWLK